MGAKPTRTVQNASAVRSPSSPARSRCAALKQLLVQAARISRGRAQGGGRANRERRSTRERRHRPAALRTWRRPYNFIVLGPLNRENGPMLTLVLALSLLQNPAPQPVPLDAPVAEPTSFVPEEVPQPLPIRAPAPPDQPVRRVLLSAAAGVGGAALGLGISMAVTTCLFTCVGKLDTNFANVALGSLMLTGVSFAIHQLLGGGGEITLPLLASLAVMFGASLLAPVIDPTFPNVQLLTTAIGAVPAALAAALILDATSHMGGTRARW